MAQKPTILRRTFYAAFLFLDLVYRLDVCLVDAGPEENMCFFAVAQDLVASSLVSIFSTFRVVSFCILLKELDQIRLQRLESGHRDPRSIQLLMHWWTLCRMPGFATICKSFHGEKNNLGVEEEGLHRGPTVWSFCEGTRLVGTWEMDSTSGQCDAF